MLRKHRCAIQTAAQGRERKQSPQVPDSPIVKIKTAKISEIGILAYFAKICTRENDQPYGMLNVDYADTGLMIATSLNFSVTVPPNASVCFKM